MRGMRSERGAAAIMTALVIVVMMGVTALAVDAGALFWDKKELQNGADAAALAIAQSCAEAKPGCDTSTGSGSLSLQYSGANKRDGNVSVERVVISGNTRSGSVTVDVLTERSLWFGPISGSGATDEVRSSATASWGLIGGATVLPITVSNCYFPLDGSGQPLVPGGEIWLPISGSTQDPNCHTGTHYAPGGWGWLDADSDCTVETHTGTWVDGSTGVSVPTACRDLLRALRGQTVLIPVFDQTNLLTGNNADFRLAGYAQLTVVAYCFSPGNVDAGGISYTRPGQTPRENCTGSNLFIRGIFERMLELDAELGGSGGNYGATTVQLTN